MTDMLYPTVVSCAMYERLVERLDLVVQKFPDIKTEYSNLCCKIVLNNPESRLFVERMAGRIVFIYKSLHFPKYQIWGCLYGSVSEIT